MAKSMKQNANCDRICRLWGLKLTAIFQRPLRSLYNICCTLATAEFSPRDPFAWRPSHHLSSTCPATDSSHGCELAKKTSLDLTCVACLVPPATSQACGKPLASCTLVTLGIFVTSILGFDDTPLSLEWTCESINTQCYARREYGE